MVEVHVLKFREAVMARHSTRLACIIEAIERGMVTRAGTALWLHPNVTIQKEPTP